MEEEIYFSFDDMELLNAPHGSGSSLQVEGIDRIEKIYASDYEALDPDYDENTLYIVVPDLPEE